MNPSDPIPDPQPLPAEINETYQELDFTDEKHQLLSCPRCKNFITGSEINIEKTIAKCNQCNHVFGFSHDSATHLLKPEQIIPEGIEVLKLKSEIDLQLKWANTTPTKGRKFFFLFAFLWNLFLLPFVLAIILSASWGLLLFISLHLSVGLGFLWYLASIYLNKTYISVTKHQIRIRTLPLRQPFQKSKEISTNEIRQLYVSQYTQSTTNGVPNYAYALYAILDHGKKVSLLRGMNKETQEYIEKEIEGFLGIKNRKVAEEISK